MSKSEVDAQTAFAPALARDRRSVAQAVGISGMNKDNGPMERLLDGLDQQSDLLSRSEVEAELAASGIDAKRAQSQVWKMIQDKPLRFVVPVEERDALIKWLAAMFACGEYYKENAIMKRR